MTPAVPARISFHGLLPSPSLEALIRAEVDALERTFRQIVSCRISVELPHRHHQHGRLYRVVVEIGVPGGHVVVGSSQDQKAMHANARIAISDAFRAVHRQLEDHRRRHGETVRVREPDAV
jgi:ribosome-associated translation inhibitor RaiA